MADLCDKSLSEGDSVNVVRGFQNLKSAKIERNDCPVYIDRNAH